jgi:hypothetical protein
MEWESQKYRQAPRVAQLSRALMIRRPGVPFMNPNMAAALGGGRGRPSDDDDDDD